jgi:hypothetical protein
MSCTKYKISDLHPTQFCLGQREVDDKLKKFQKLSHSDLDDVMKQKSVPLVLGPDNKIYLIDRHHTVSTLILMNISETYGHVMGDLRSIPVDNFWTVMELCNWTWLYDEKHVKRKPSELPTKFSHLINDPYRSLTYMLREQGVLNKSESIPFIEFAWGAVIRKKVVATSHNLDESFTKTLSLLVSGNLLISDCDLKRAKELLQKDLNK